MAESPHSQPLQVGVLLISDLVQLLDLAPIDLFTTLQPEYLDACGLPEEIVALGIKSEIHYITEDGDKPVNMTSGVRIQPTTSILECPSLDILLLPGPHPLHEPSSAVVQFLHNASKKVSALLAICTGAMTLARAGVLNGIPSACPRLMLPLMEKTVPQVRWQKKRYIQHENIWTSAEVTNGLDMMQAYLRSAYPAAIVELALYLNDMYDRGESFDGDKLPSRLVSNQTIPPHSSAIHDLYDCAPPWASKASIGYDEVGYN
ncbi:class I glutamine amidotransferase-like protein [Penicillium cataractarum]|uniref:Class I glutamine amidotransferase-like protein n=1 Tax=Penicillium cataractarum TaxID=2100454 RepID=A0A9W9S2S9_9EURO|nr:class I glutamine amidotransferase-like protein [Penicillium cataractarum]KAJ5368548.1 class I glutamine amidotransferase-like protein [Penicillium cataractarum]